MRNDADIIVIGAGAMGLAAARSLTERGRSVLVLERFEVGHHRGSSGGPTRIFRLSYHHPDYVRMARLALEEWRDLEAKAGETLLITTAGLDVGEGGRQTAEALEAAGERFEYLSADALAERWPALRIDPSSEAFVQEDGGVCMAERTVRALARLATAAGATIREGTTVDALRSRPDGVEVRTSEATYRAPAAVVAAGAWAGRILVDAGIPLRLQPSLEQVTYFAMEEPASLPTIIDWEADRVRTPYLVPDPEQPGAFKVALHLSGPPVDPDTRSFQPDPVRLATVVEYTRTRIRGRSAMGATETCLYTNAPDEDFVLDRRGPIVIASPCSGHGFKFTPLVGRIVADLATGERPPLALERFAANRPALAV